MKPSDSPLICISHLPLANKTCVGFSPSPGPEAPTDTPVLTDRQQSAERVAGESWTTPGTAQVLRSLACVISGTASRSWATTLPFPAGDSAPGKTSYPGRGKHRGYAPSSPPSSQSCGAEGAAAAAPQDPRPGALRQRSVQGAPRAAAEAQRAPEPFRQLDTEHVFLSLQRTSPLQDAATRLLLETSTFPSLGRPEGMSMAPTRASRLRSRTLT